MRISYGWQILITDLKGKESIGPSFWLCSERRAESLRKKSPASCPAEKLSIPRINKGLEFSKKAEGLNNLPEKKSLSSTGMNAKRLKKKGRR